MLLFCNLKMTRSNIYLFPIHFTYSRQYCPDFNYQFIEIFIRINYLKIIFPFGSIIKSRLSIRKLKLIGLNNSRG